MVCLLFIVRHGVFIVRHSLFIVRRCAFIVRHSLCIVTHGESCSDVSVICSVNCYSFALYSFSFVFLCTAWEMSVKRFSRLVFSAYLSGVGHE